MPEPLSGFPETGKYELQIRSSLLESQKLVHVKSFTSNQKPDIGFGQTHKGYTYPTSLAHFLGDFGGRLIFLLGIPDRGSGITIQGYDIAVHASGITVQGSGITVKGSGSAAKASVEWEYRFWV